MRIQYPVHVDTAHEPGKIGIFHGAGYWLPTYYGSIELPETERDLADKIAWAINAAHERGREDLREQLRDLLGVKTDDE